MTTPTTIEAPVAQVTLMEDRAQAQRRATLTLPAGATRLRVPDVAPVLVDRTLCGRLSGPAAARVSDARVVRRALARTADRPEEARALREELEAGQEEQRRQHRRLERLALHEEELAGLAETLLADLAVDAAWERLDPAAARDELARLADEERQVRDRRLQLQHEIEELERDLALLARRIDATEDPGDAVAAELRLEVIADEAGEYELTLDYLVPGACWRPYHRATLATAGEGSELTFATEGCVWQNTGEDWDEVLLVFSTERPSLGTEPPSLSTDVLAIQRRREVLEVEVREQEIQTTGPGGPRKTTAPELPGIDDGGEALALRATDLARVPSDGRPHRVPLGSFTEAVTLARVAMPELAEAVLLKTTQANGGDRPLLAGPVDLVRGGGYAGRTSVLFVAPGERFDLGWGPDPALRLLREVEHSAEDKGMLSSWIKQDTAVTVRLSNIGAAAATVRVQERVPVSEIEKVQIEVDAEQTTGHALPDDDGVVAWEVDLAGYGREKLELVYQVRKHSDVVGV